MAYPNLHQYTRIIFRDRLVAIFVLLTAYSFSIAAHAATPWYRDSSRPTVSISSPTTGATFAPGTVTITGTASDARSGIAKVEARVYNVAPADTSLNTRYVWATPKAAGDWSSWSVNINLSKAARYRLLVQATDKAGNLAWAETTINIKSQTSDTTAPTVSITSPATNLIYTVPQTVTLTAAASDNVAVTKVEFFDNGNLKGTSRTSPYTQTWAVSNSINGKHSWTAKAYDAAGNSATSSPVNLTVNIAPPDTIRPSLSITGPATGATFAPGIVTLIGTASDGGSGLANVQARVYNVSPADTSVNTNYVAVTPKAPGDWSSWSINMNLTKETSHRLLVQAADKAGNLQWAETTINIQSPTTGWGDTGSYVFDDFEDGPYELVDGQISPNGKWRDHWNGSNPAGERGKAGVKINSEGKKVFYQVQPAPIGDSTSNGGTTSGTSSGQVLSVANDFKDYKVSFDVRTLRSMRPDHNGWEVAWFFFRFVDRSKHYYFYVGYNGWELGKKDVNLLPNGQIDREEQRFLATGNSFRLPLGVWQHWDIEVVGNHIKVSINGATIVDVVDNGSLNDFQGPIPAMCSACYQGHLGMYNEDADVEYDNIVITPLPQ